MIHLAIGRLEIDWGKNHGFSNHSALFQIGDVSKVPYYYAGDGIKNPDTNEYEYEIVTELKEGLSKPLKEVCDRIDLLGYTLANCRKEFFYTSKLSEFDPKKFPFEQLLKILSEIDVQSISPDYGEGGEDFGKFVRREILPRLGLKSFGQGPNVVEWSLSYALENLSSYSIIKMLSFNKLAKDLPVYWAFNDLEVGGWGRRSEFVKPLDQSNRFLIVTEGSSDASIIKHAFSILRPHICDFFDYVDMKEGYPFSGTGNLYNFVKGLISIAVQNNVVVIFDNDAEGVSKFNQCHSLNVPGNMRILKLPDLPEFESFNALGPDGMNKANINGRGAAIECYLDIETDAHIRWSNFLPTSNTYQGAILNKEEHTRKFLGLREKSESYNYSKIEAVLDLIVKTCVEMKEKEVSDSLEVYIPE